MKKTRQVFKMTEKIKFPKINVATFNYNESFKSESTQHSKKKILNHKEMM